MCKVCLVSFVVERSSSIEISDLSAIAETERLQLRVSSDISNPSDYNPLAGSIPKKKGFALIQIGSVTTRETRSSVQRGRS